MKLYVNNPVQTDSACCRIVADLTGQKLEIVNVSDDAVWKGLGTSADRAQVLETAEGVLHGHNAISKYFCALAGGKFLGGSAVEKSHVDQWIAFSNTTLLPCVRTIGDAIFGLATVTKADYDEASKNLKVHMKVLNTHLDGKKWLVGNEMTVADIVVVLVLQHAFQTVLDAGFRKTPIMKNVNAWAEACFALPAVIKVQGNVHMCAKPLKPVLAVEEKKVKKVAAVAAPPQPKAEKVKDNVESLPPTPFNVYDFKTLYVNHPDKKGAAVDTWYEMLDWEGWAFWFFHYEKYEGEGIKLHITNNLLTGFMSRAEHTSKYTFARHGVFGEEPNLEIMGVWLCRGKDEIPDGLVKEHPQFEYYKNRKLNPRENKEDDKLIREFFGGKEEETINGLKAQTLRWHK